MDSLRSRLEREGLGKYVELFAEHSIGVDVLADLTEADLEKLGLPMGDRRRFLKAAWRAVAVDTPQTQVVAPGREAERRQLNVMFTDLVDSTRLAARLDPEDMKDVIAKYQKAVGEEVTRFGGFVAKPLGDGLLIYFGWPRAHEDDAARAVRCALAAVAAVRRLTAPSGVVLAARIGIATGEVVVGDFTGSGVDEEGAVVGETPNLAARLQAVAGENTIVVAEETRRLIGQQFAIADLGEQRLKGFDRPVRAWRVEGERSSQSRFDAMHGARLGQFVGREHEIGLLVQRWEEATHGECQLVLITGEAGIGKSRLVAEFIGRMEKARRIAYQASPLHSNTALYPVVRYLQSRAGFAASDTSVEKWRKLEAAISSQHPRRGLALQYLAELMSLDTPSEDAAGAKPSVDEQREAAFEVLADATQSETGPAPLLIVVEDAHWLDATTLEFVERLLDQLQHCAAMVLVTFRPEFAPPWAQHANVGLLSLSRFGRRDARAIIDSMLLHGQNLPPEIADGIVAKSDGIPLFVEELTGSILAAKGTDDRPIQIPATLRDALSERLDRLGSAKEVALVAAAFGREFAADLVAATLLRSETDLEDDLKRLTSIDVVFQSSRSGRRFTFRHALLQEAAYESMLKSKRREVHARIAEVLSHHRPEMAETEPEVLATHLARAGDMVRAAECWRKAGQMALRNSAYREAIGAFKNALPLPPDDDAKARADTNRAIASAYFATGDYDSMREHLATAAADAEVANDQVMMAEIATQQGHDLMIFGLSLPEAVQFGERALEIATRLDDDALAIGARFSLGQSAWASGDFVAGIRILTANLPENLLDPGRARDFAIPGSLMIDSMATLGSMHAFCGEFDQALALLDRAANIPTVNEFDFVAAQYHLNRSLLQKGDVTRALPLLIKSVKHVTEAGVRFALPWHQALLGYARALTEEVEEGVSLLRQALADADRMHLRYTQVFASAFLAESLVPREPGTALEVAEAGLNLARKHGYRAHEAELLRVKAAALTASDPGTAEALVKDGMALARRLSMRPEEAHALRVLGDIQSGEDRQEAARENRDRARAIYRDLGMAFWRERMS